MKRFIRNILFFISIPILFFGINMVINYLNYNNQTISITETSILIAGDSHPQKSLNPKYFNNAQNISQSAEPYALTFWKLKNIFKSYIPDTLIIGFAPHNISQFNDLKFSENRWSSEMFRRSYAIQEFKHISDKISIDYSTFYKVLWKNTAFYPKKNHTTFLGSYSNSKISNISDFNTAIKRHYYKNDIELNVSKLSINFLDSIVTLANSKKIKLIMVSNPVHHKYLKNIPTAIMDKFDQLIDQYKTTHIVFDKTRDYYPDSLYLNSDHLNAMGAKRFTKELNTYIATKLSSIDNANKKQFYRELN
ncbi:hypothetical protein [Tenacibaculum sp. 190524A05c]|uniref:DUF1574 domain-containing protein n=1 Tax=Tenacibaculum platacis TaxID=3137852 RepID=A0ABM9NRM3_9FLAO